MHTKASFIWKTAALFAILTGCLLILLVTELSAADTPTKETSPIPATTIAWEKDLQQTLALAQKEGKPVLLDFFSPL